MNKKERLFFLTDVRGIAKKGEIKEVESAFSRNFLLPKKKALIYNSLIDKQIQHQKVKLQEQQLLKRNKEEEIFMIINQKKLIFLLKERNGRVFGSVTISDIIRSLGEKFSIWTSKKNFPNFKPLNKGGENLVEVKVGKNLNAKLQVIINSS